MSKENFVELVGNNINSRRKQLRLTQETLAERVGVNQDTISRVENGTTPPKFEKLPDYAAALGCSILDLFHTPDEGLNEYAATFTDMIRGLSPEYQKKMLHFVSELVEIMKDN